MSFGSIITHPNLYNWQKSELLRHELGMGSASPKLNGDRFCYMDNKDQSVHLVIAERTMKSGMSTI